MDKKDDKSSDNKTESGQYTDPQVSVAAISARTTIIVAIIGLIGTFAGLYLTYLQWSASRVTPTPPPNSPTSAPTTEAVPSLTELVISPGPILSDLPTLETIQTDVPVSPINTPTLSNLAPGMRVIINVTRTSGKAPFNVNFNAGDSYLLTEDSIVIKCGACSFTWSIRLGSKFIYGPEKKDASFSYTFSKKGSYFVIVKVCRNSENEECSTSGITIVAN